MKLEEKKLEILGSLGEESYEASISQEDLGKMWDMLQNPYKNNIGSIIREITSNCFDSHAEAGVTDAVRLYYGKDETGIFISFEDVGVGLSPDRVKSIFTRYLKSTKENSNKFIGAFGIGSKSPLSYQDLFYINTRFNGIEYNYIMRKGEGAPVIDLLKKKSTSERNGTEIRLNIKNENDLIKFLKETRNQLQYFSNVDINLTSLEKIYGNSYNDTISLFILELSTDYNIVEGEHFLYRTKNNSFKEMHLVIGSVAYPIDWSNLGVLANKTPIALKFEIGDLSVIQTREDIRYTEENIKKIKEKIDLVKEELTNLKKKEVLIEIDTLHSFMQLDIFDKHNILTLENKKDLTNPFFITTYDLIDFKSIPAYQIKDFPIKFTDYQNSKDFFKFISNFGFSYLDGAYQNNRIIDDYVLPEKSFTANNSLKSIKHELNQFKLTSFRTFHGLLSKMESFIYTLQNDHIQYILIDDSTKFTTKKNKYINIKLYASNSVKFITSKIPKIDPFFLKEIYKDNRVELRKFNISFKMFSQILLQSIKDLDFDIKALVPSYKDIVVDEVWWAEYQKQNKKVTDYDKTAIALERVTFNYGNLHKDKTTYRPCLEDYVNKHSFRILLDKDMRSKFVSGAYDNYTTFENFFIMLNSFSFKNKLSIDIVSNRNYFKILESRKDFSNIYTIEEFFNNKKIQMKHFGKLLTIIKISQDINSNYLFNTGKSWQDISALSYIFSSTLKDYIDQINEIYIKGRSFTNALSGSKMNSLLFEDLDNISFNDDLLDKELVNKYSTVINFIKESNFNMTDTSFISTATIIKNYKPAKQNIRFHDFFYKKIVTKDDFVDFYYRISNVVNDGVQTTEMLYNSIINTSKFKSKLSLVNTNYSAPNSLRSNVNYGSTENLEYLALIYYYYFDIASSTSTIIDITDIIIPVVIETVVEEVEENAIDGEEEIEEVIEDEVEVLNN